jgi:hypothetical protein
LKSDPVVFTNYEERFAENRRVPQAAGTLSLKLFTAEAEAFTPSISIAAILTIRTRRISERR